MTVQRLVVPETRRMRRGLLWVAVLASLLFWSDTAEARRCGHGYIKRVSLGICVGRSSRAARGFVASGRRQSRYYLRHRHFVKHRHVAPVAVEPDELPDDVMVTPSTKSQERIERSGKAARLPAVPEEAPATVELPVGISGSLLMRPPVQKSFDWLSTEHQRPGGSP